MRDDEESSEEPLCDLLGHGMIGVHLKERLAPVPDWLYPCILTVRTVQHAEWEVDQYLAIAFARQKRNLADKARSHFWLLWMLLEFAAVRHTHFAGLRIAWYDIRRYQYCVNKLMLAIRQV